MHGERSISVVRATSPFDGALGIVGIAAGPDPDLDSHGRLWVICTRGGVGVVQGADDLAIDQPFDSTGIPVDGVGVEGCCWVGDGHGGGTVVGGCVALAKVVGLDEAVASADLFLEMRQ